MNVFDITPRRKILSASMKKCRFVVPCFLVSLAFSISPAFSSAAPVPEKNAACPAGWTSLLDEKLSHWEVFLGVPDPGIKVPGHTHARGKPIGLRDPNGIYRVKLEGGEPVLHVTGEILGGLTSLKSYENYHLRLQFRWGKKRWKPRVNSPRDSGILYHCVGKHGAFGNVWMRSVELQIQENDVGDFFPLCGSGADFPAVEEAGKLLRYTPGAPLVPAFKRVVRGKDYHEKPNGEWNDVELIVIGSTAVHVLNGRVVNVLHNIRYATGKSFTRKETELTAGKLQIQSEYAEVEYRRIEIKPVKTFPAAFAGAAKK
ncbi:MAG: DUF1080 domain-containing protein [Puniceicoccales bacterium]|jgi:hypothetical protein|nr:DUF1080 domain-containing protein [Puniceicoccales bacterium]